VIDEAAAPGARRRPEVPPVLRFIRAAARPRTREWPRRRPPAMPRPARNRARSLPSLCAGGLLLLGALLANLQLGGGFAHVHLDETGPTLHQHGHLGAHRHDGGPGQEVTVAAAARARAGPASEGARPGPRRSSRPSPEHSGRTIEHAPQPEAPTPSEPEPGPEPRMVPLSAVPAVSHQDPTRALAPPTNRVASRVRAEVAAGPEASLREAHAPRGPPGAVAA
jgi:hypothetical protein